MNKHNDIPEKSVGIIQSLTNPEYIRAITPLMLAVVGCVIGGMVIFAPQGNEADAKWSAGMGLAGTAITGAAGLAQSNGKSS